MNVVIWVSAYEFAKAVKEAKAFAETDKKFRETLRSVCVSVSFNADRFSDEETDCVVSVVATNQKELYARTISGIAKAPAELKNVAFVVREPDEIPFSNKNLALIQIDANDDCDFKTASVQIGSETMFCEKTDERFPDWQSVFKRFDDGATCVMSIPTDVARKTKEAAKRKGWLVKDCDCQISSTNFGDAKIATIKLVNKKTEESVKIVAIGLACEAHIDDFAISARALETILKTFRESAVVYLFASKQDGSTKPKLVSATKDPIAMKKKCVVFAPLHAKR